MNLVQYQSEAVEKLVQGFKELTLAGNPNATIILKSPTGSGKTVMVAAMLDQLRQENLPSEFVYIWASMGDLAHQSYDKLNNHYLADSEYNMLEIGDIGSEPLPANTILFCNWEKMFKTGKGTDDDGNEIEIFANVFVRIGEDGRNLQEVLEKTREQGLKVVLIVDEAHRTYLGPKSQKLVEEVIKPNLTIEVSATPILKLEQGYHENNTGRFIEVKLRDVIDSGLIKNNTIINNDIAGVIDKNSTDDVVLAAALKQRDYLVSEYKKLGSNVNPLVLVQLPTESADKMSEADQTTREKVEKFMESQGITYDNGKLAIWVSGDHYPEDVKEVTPKNDSEIEVLIFKQAIATGWDCPRASILVMLRDIKSVVFEIQTVGRILRMPELKHYENSALNTAFVYTNINDMALREDEDTRTFFKTHTSHRAKDFSDNFVWSNVYRKRIVGSRHRLNRNFRRIFFPLMNEYFSIKQDDDKETRVAKLDDKLEIYADELAIPILSDISFEHLDSVDKTTLESANQVKLTADKPYIERIYNLFLKSASSPYAPHDSSRILKDALYKWFSDNGFDDEAEVQRIIACSKANQDVLNEVIDAAKEKFAETMDKETELAYTTFSIPKSQEFGDGYEMHGSKKQIMEPYYRPIKMWTTEEKFEKKLDESESVDWWFRNGINQPKYFGTPYLKLNKDGIEEEAIFYPDYIVKFKDGTYGVFDTKSGDTTRPGTTLGGSVDEKANGFQSFLRQYDFIAKICKERCGVEPTDGKCIWGGLVKVVDENHFELQADAITHEMALARMAGKDIEIPEVNYDPNEWNKLVI